MSVKHFLIAALVMFAVFGCKPGVPGKYLQPDEMADILYDYHLAEGVVNVSMYNDSIAMRSFKASILKKYGVKVADFDSSMVYYTRHTKLLEDVYTKLSDRFNKESSALGGSSMGIDGAFASADTTNVWQLSPSFVLSPYAATNRMTFEIKADTAYHKGDRLMLDFDTQFIYQDGMRDASVVLAVTYDNDSVGYVTNNIMSSSHYHMQVDNSGRLGIKAIRGFWMLSSDTSDPTASATTLKLLVVSNVKLIRLHVAEPENVPGDKADSLGKQRIDSLPKSPAPAGNEPKKPEIKPLRRDLSGASLKQGPAMRLEH